jgi:hypothetical protein
LHHIWISIPIRRFSVTIDIAPVVFLPLAEAWQRACLPSRAKTRPLTFPDFDGPLTAHERLLDGIACLLL